MYWNEIHIVTCETEAHQISECLLEYGAEAITFQDGGDDPIFEPNRELPPSPLEKNQGDWFV